MNNCKPPAKKLRQFLKEFGDGIPDKEILSATTKQKMKNWTGYCDKDGIVSAARYDPNDWYLCTLKNAAVRTDRRGEGIGRKLYLEVTKKALGMRTNEGYHRCSLGRCASSTSRTTGIPSPYYRRCCSCIRC